MRLSDDHHGTYVRTRELMAIAVICCGLIAMVPWAIFLFWGAYQGLRVLRVLD